MQGSGALRREPGLRTVAEAVGLTVLAFVVSLVAGVAFVVPLVVLGYGVQTTLVLVGSTAAGQLGMLALGSLYLQYRDLSVPVRTPTASALGYAVVGTVAALVTAVGLSLALAALNLLPGSVVGDAAETDPTLLLGLAALSVVVVAPVEEFVFRGVIQRRLVDRFGTIPGVAGASLLFGSMHLANYTGRLAPVVAGALLIAAVGAVFGTVYERTDNLVVPVLVHATYNVVLLLVSYAAAVSA